MAKKVLFYPVCMQYIMASLNSDYHVTFMLLLQKGRPYNQEFYFHIQGGNRLNIARADAHPLWKDIPEVTSSYHTVQCARVHYYYNIYTCDKLLNLATNLFLPSQFPNKGTVLAYMTAWY